MLQAIDSELVFHVSRAATARKRWLRSTYGLAAVVARGLCAPPSSRDPREVLRWRHSDYRACSMWHTVRRQARRLAAPHSEWRRHSSVCPAIVREIQYRGDPL